MLLLQQRKYRVHGIAAGAAAVLGVDGEAGAVGAVVRVGHREAARGRTAVVRVASGVSVARERGRLVLQLADVVAEDKSQSGSLQGRAPGAPLGGQGAQRAQDAEPQAEARVRHACTRTHLGQRRQRRVGEEREHWKWRLETWGLRPVPEYPQSPPHAPDVVPRLGAVGTVPGVCTWCARDAHALLPAVLHPARAGRPWAAGRPCKTPRLTLYFCQLQHQTTELSGYTDSAGTTYSGTPSTSGFTVTDSYNSTNSSSFNVDTKYGGGPGSYSVEPGMSQLGSSYGGCYTHTHTHPHTHTHIG